MSGADSISDGTRFCRGGKYSRAALTISRPASFPPQLAKRAGLHGDAEKVTSTAGARVDWGEPEAVLVCGEEMAFVSVAILRACLPLLSEPHGRDVRAEIVWLRKRYSGRCPSRELLSSCLGISNLGGGLWRHYPSNLSQMLKKVARFLSGFSRPWPVGKPGRLTRRVAHRRD